MVQSSRPNQKSKLKLKIENQKIKIENRKKRFYKFHIPIATVFPNKVVATILVLSYDVRF